MSVVSSQGSLKDRHIENGAVMYAMFTPKENLKQFPQTPKREVVETYGNNMVRCHIMLKVRLNLIGDYNQLMIK